LKKQASGLRREALRGLEEKGRLDEAQRKRTLYPSPDVSEKDVDTGAIAASEIRKWQMKKEKRKRGEKEPRRE